MAGDFSTTLKPASNVSRERYGRLRNAGNGNKADPALSLEAEFCGQRWIDHCNLAAGIHHEIERASLVDLHGNNNECVLNQSRGYTSGVSRAARLCFDCGKNDQRQADCGEQLKAAGGEQVFHVDLRLAGCEVGRH